MAETRRRFDREFREGAVRVVREAGKPIAQVARNLKGVAVRLGVDVADVALQCVEALRGRR